MTQAIIEIIPHAGDGALAYHRISSFPCTIGRGYHNDLILNDPHVGAKHFSIEHDDGGWLIRDLGSENGVTLNGKHLREPATVLKSGDHIRVGRTEIRFFEPQHAVTPAVRLARANALTLFLSKSLVVWSAFALAIALLTGWTYLTVWTEAEDTASRLGAVAAAAFACILIWSGLWAAAGRLIRHKSRFRNHVALFSLYLIAIPIVSTFESYTDFLTNENWFSTVFSYGTHMVLLVCLLYGCLTLTTDMPRRRRVLSSTYFTLGLTIGILALSMASQRDFTPQPEYPAGLQPYLAGLAPADTLDDFMKGSAKLFESETFAKATAPKAK
ncbi:MAG: FHA domain-containing protein [Alphaproteobacteria bacterium]